MAKNILYLGMADDILTPLLLCPDFDNLFVMDDFDEAFSTDDTLDSQRDDIIKILEQGYADRSIYPDEELYLSLKKGREPTYKHYLEGKSEIISDVRKENVWRLKFKYLDKIRYLTVFSEDFLKNAWNDEITNISDIITIGAYDIDCYQKSPCNNLIQMLSTRCLPQINFYCLSYFTFNVFTEHLILRHGRCNIGDEIGKLVIDTTGDIHKFLMSLDKNKEPAQIKVRLVDTGKLYICDL